MLTLIEYDPERHEREQSPDLAKLEAPASGVRWFDVDTGGERAVLEPLAERRGLHKLTLDDLVSERQRAKLEDYEDYLFLVLKQVRLIDGLLDVEQTGLLVWPGLTLTVQLTPGDVFDGVRKRLATPRTPIRGLGADRLAVALADAVVDGYFVVLETTVEEVEALEERVLQAADRGEIPELAELHVLRRRLRELKHAAWPMRELALALERSDSPLIGEKTRPYIRDLRDHALYAIELIEAQREALASLHELHRSLVAQRTNDVMRLLSVIATIFMPLTFVVGVYGMNFKWIPELEWAWGYPLVWALMLAISGALLVIFGRRGWLS